MSNAAKVERTAQNRSRRIDRDQRNKFLAGINAPRVLELRKKGAVRRLRLRLLNPATAHLLPTLAKALSALAKATREQTA